MSQLALLNRYKPMFGTITMALLATVLMFAQSSPVQAQWGTNGNNINNTNSGNVGIGTTVPGEKLVTVGNGTFGNITSRTQLYSTYDTQGNVSLEVGYGTATSSITPLPVLVISKNLTSTNNALGNIFFANSSLANGSEKRMSGIGAWTDGATNSGNLIFYTTAAGVLNERMRISAAGNIGIGTATPDAVAKLHLFGSGGFGQDIQTSSADWTRLRFVTPTRTVGFLLDGGSAGLGTGKFGLYDYTASTWRLVTDTSGNVGIGTATPSASYKLDVNGAINATGNINSTGDITAAGNISAKYQDVAEWVESSQALPAGTVVVLDHTKSNQVIASSQPYDTRVAGVISAQPGIMLGVKSDSKVLVATTGRVKIKVDASSGPIAVGDLLVTSDKAGVAQKSIPLNLGGAQLHRPGTLIGKALEPLANGTGEILVLLSLQ